MTKDGSYIREIRADCGAAFRAVEIFHYSDGRAQAARRKRKTKTMLSSPAQQSLNDKRSRRYLLQLILSNFGPGDYVAHLTYDDKHLPKTYEDAQRQAKRFLDRIAYRLRKEGKEPLKYICITTEGAVHGRLHHHIFLSCQMGRDEIEDLWWAVKGSKGKPREMLGGANVDRLKDWKGNGVLEMAEYVTRQAKGKKKWTQSQNLDKPKIRKACDSKYSCRQLDRLLREDTKSDLFAGFLRRYYQGWRPVRSEIVQPDREHGWGGGIYLLLRREDASDSG